MSWRRLLCDERQRQVTDNPVKDRVLGQEGCDLHPPAAAGADHRVHFIDFPDYLAQPLEGSRGISSAAVRSGTPHRPASRALPRGAFA